MLSCLQLKVQPAASSLYHFTEIILYFLNRFREIFGGADGLTIGITQTQRNCQYGTIHIEWAQNLHTEDLLLDVSKLKLHESEN